MVTAAEEAGKAILLELANVNYVDKEMVKQSMHDHRPKKLVLLAMEKGLLFANRIDRRNDSCELNEDTLKRLENMLIIGLEDLEDKRQNGFYVQVDASNGAITRTPKSIKRSDIDEFAKKTGLFLKLCSYLCQFFEDYRNHPARNNLRVLQYNLDNLNMSYDEA